MYFQKKTGVHGWLQDKQSPPSETLLLLSAMLISVLLMDRTLVRDHVLVAALATSGWDQVSIVWTAAHMTITFQ